MFKRILQFGALALLLVPSAAFADTFNLTGGSWTDSGGVFTLTNGSTTLKTGAINSFFFFGSSGDTGAVSTTAFSCTDCVTTHESFTLTGLFTPTIALSGTIADGGVTGAFSADLIDLHDFSGNSGSIESGFIDLNIPATGPATPAPEPSTWVLLLAGLAMLGTAAFSRKMGWLSQVTEQGSES